MIITDFTAEQVVDAVETAWTNEDIIAINFKKKEIATLQEQGEYIADVFFNSRDYADVYDYIAAIKQEVDKHANEAKTLYTDILILLGA